MRPVKWKYDNGYDEYWVIPEEVETLIRLGIKALTKYLAEPDRCTLTLSTKEGIMSNYQLNANDSVVVTITDTDDVTGEVVIPDVGSVTAVLSNANDSVVVDPSGTFLTLTAAGATSSDNTLTVNATVLGVPAGPAGGAVGTYDVVADVVPPPASTTLALSFGTETSPAAAAPDGVDISAFVGNGVGTGAGQINPTTGLVNP
jgi:hypothetical protein